MNEEYISHYGVLGMKWGVRKDRKPQGVSGDGTPIHALKRSTGQKAKTRYQSPPRKLTDAELNRRVKRMRLEKEYNQLNASEINAGARIVTKTILGSAKASASLVLVPAMVWAGKKAFMKLVGMDRAAEMFSSKKR